MRRLSPQRLLLATLGLSWIAACSADPEAPDTGKSDDSADQLRADAGSQDPPAPDPSASDAGAPDAPEGCGYISLEGTCEDEIAVWCDNGSLLSENCGELGMTCCGGDSNIACPANDAFGDEFAHCGG